VWHYWKNLKQGYLKEFHDVSGKRSRITERKNYFLGEIAWIKVQEKGEFLQVPVHDLESANESFSLPRLRFISIAAKIR